MQRCKKGSQKVVHEYYPGLNQLSFQGSGQWCDAQSHVHSPSGLAACRGPLQSCKRHLVVSPHWEVLTQWTEQQREVPIMIDRAWVQILRVKPSVSATLERTRTSLPFWMSLRLQAQGTSFYQFSDTLSHPPWPLSWETKQGFWTKLAYCRGWREVPQWEACALWMNLHGTMILELPVRWWEGRRSEWTFNSPRENKYLVTFPFTWKVLVSG